MRLSFIPFLFLLVPLTEIAVFVLVGSQIGVLATIGLVVATATLGVILLRVQGLGVASRISRSIESGEVPGRELVHGMMILMAGFLLLTPGFVTDTLGFLLFIPAIRDSAWSLLRDRIVMAASFAGRATGAGGAGRSRSNATIDLDDEEFSRDNPQSPPDRKPISGR